MSEITKPSHLNLEVMLEFLDYLRESGVINMFGAAPYVQREFALTLSESREVLNYWIDTFSERHPNG